MKSRLPVFVASLLFAGLLLCPQSGRGESPAVAAPPKAAEGVNSAWFQVSSVGEKVWRIDDHGIANCYLIVGSQRALLIDTGGGVANLRRVVEGLTSLPVLVVNTHGHPDHVGANPQFGAVYAPPADFDAIRYFSSPEERRRAREWFQAGSVPSEERAPDAPGASASELKPVGDGEVFDLGGRSLEVLAMPGHTPGEIVLLDRQHKLLFGGDNNNVLVWLHLKTCLPLSVYLESLEKLSARRSEFTTILPGHGGPLPTSFLDEQVACVKGILDGTLKDESYQSSAGPGRLAKYQTAAVAFNPDNLR